MRDKLRFWEKIDTALILLNCSACFSILPYIIFFQYNRGIFVILIAALNIIYLSFRYGLNTELPSAILFILYLIINIWNSYASLYTDTGYLLCTAYMIANATFYLIIYNCYLKYINLYTVRHSLWLIIRGYIYLEIVCILSAVLTFVVLKLGYTTTNNINGCFDLFADNVESLGANYYSVLGMGIVLKSATSFMRLFSENGIVCGIYHEPHIITFMVFPSLFFMWAYAKNNYHKIAILLAGIFIAAIASSTTNILTALICICIALSYSKKGKLILIPIVFICLLLVLSIGLENTELFFIADKLDNAGGSRDYSLKSLEFAFLPQTWIGSNIINTSYIEDLGSGKRDIGYLMALLNLIFLFMAFFNIIKLILQKERFNCLMGIGCLYFFLHSFKTASVSYTFSILAMIVFILSYSLKSKQLLLNRHV